jgi:hypothetical protein
MDNSMDTQNSMMVNSGSEGSMGVNSEDLVSSPLMEKNSGINNQTSLTSRQLGGALNHSRNRLSQLLS